MFKQIVNPVNNKLVNVKSKEGLEILNNYINKLGGAEQSTGQSTSESEHTLDGSHQSTGQSTSERELVVDEGELVDEPCMCVGCEQERERIADGLIGHDRIQRYIMANWLRDDINDIDFDDVPGMTEQLKNNMGLIGISNIYQLFGACLSLITPDVLDGEEPNELLNDNLRNWLRTMGVDCENALNLLTESLLEKLELLGFPLD